MKYGYILLVIFMMASCQKETKSQVPKSSSVSSEVKDDFSDLKKEDDESCEDESVEKILEKKKESVEIKLQGGNSEDCTVE